MRIAFTLFFLLSFSYTALNAQVQIDSAFADIELMNVDSSKVKVGDFKDSKAVVLIFTGIHCVYAKKYEDRLLQTIEEYKDQPVTFLLVNSNDPELSPENGFEKMAARAREKAYPSPYLSDPDQLLSTALAVKKVPETIVFGVKDDELTLIYRGAIDNNPLMGDRATLHYLKDALGHILSGNETPVPFQPVKGCNIKSLNY